MNNRESILYIGNKLKRHGLNPTSVETLGEMLKEINPIIQVSDKRLWFFRLLHIWYSIVKFSPKVKCVIIDTYSTNAFHFAWTSAVFCKMLNLKYIPILHGGGFSERIQSSPILVGWYLRNAFQNISPSNFLKELVLQEFNNVKVKVIPNFIHIGNYPLYVKSLDQTNCNLFWLRSFDKIYNPVLAIKILFKLRNYYGINASLTMVGPTKDESYKDVLAQIEKLNLQDYVSLPGRLDKPEWIELSKSHNIFINTTTTDNTPVSLIEALALGLPVVSTNVGGIPYMISSKQNAILVESGNVDAFCEAIFQLITDKRLLNRIVNQGRVMAEEWDWQVVKKKWTQLIESTKI